MLDLCAIRRMLALFRKFREPTQQPDNWYVHTNNYKRNWGKFADYLIYQTIFREDWRDTLIRFFYPTYRNKYRQGTRRENIDRLVRRAEKLGLVQLHKRHASMTMPSDIDIQLKDEGVDFVEHFSDFLKVFLDVYGYAVSFLIGAIPPLLLWLSYTLPYWLVENGIIPI